MDQIAKARLFQQMHLGPEVLVIANAWDAASARVFEDAGVRAVGTGSAGIAFSHGYPDNEFIPRMVLIAATAEIARSVHVPVTADILNGFGEAVEDAVAAAKEVIALGAVGVNLEDATEVNGPRLIDIELAVEKVRAVCAAARDSGVPIVVNARTDSYWLDLGDDKQKLRESIERGNRFREAGAHCIFVPSAVNRETIRTLAAEIDAPLNILTVGGCPPIAELQTLGVRRVSEGSGPMRATMMLTRQIARELLQSGTYTRFHGNAAVPYREANRLFERDRRINSAANSEGPAGTPQSGA